MLRTDAGPKFMIFSRSISYMPRQTQKDYWEDQWAQRTFEKQVAAGPKKRWWPLLLEEVERLDRNALILEAGCGMGQFVHLLHERGHRVRGVDVAEEAIRATSDLNPKLDLAVEDVGRLSLPDASVAMYISLGVVEHAVEGPDRVLAEAARVLQDDGVLFITVPYLNLYRRVREPWWRMKHRLLRSERWRSWARQQPIEFYQYAYGRAEFLRILRNHGFHAERILRHHASVALTKDFGTMRWFRRMMRHKSRPDALDTKAVRRLAERLDRLSPRIMSHMLLVVARREPRA